MITLENSPKVSVVIATFNSEETIRTAIESVLNQTYKNIECLIIDGASNDNTIGIVKEYAQKDNRIRCISEPDKGIYDAYNKGWRNATGQWILYLGSDDFLFPAGLESLIKSSENYDVVYGATELRFFNTGKKKIQHPLSPDQIRKLMPACHQSFIVRSDIISEMNGFDMTYKIYSDFDLIQRIYKKGYKFNAIPKVVSSFFVGGASSDNLKAYKEIYRLLKSNGLCKHYNLYICWRFTRAIIVKFKHSFERFYSKIFNR